MALKIYPDINLELLRNTSKSFQPHIWWEELCVCQQSSKPRYC